MSKECKCGCAEPTGSDFRPGHDARLVSRLVQQAATGDGAAADQARQQVQALDRPKLLAKFDKALERAAQRAMAPEQTPRTVRPQHDIDHLMLQLAQHQWTGLYGWVDVPANGQPAQRLRAKCVGVEDADRLRVRIWDSPTAQPVERLVLKPAFIKNDGTCDDGGWG